MIIVKLQGGLGNQLFQYAFGRNLAKKNNSCLKLDLSFFEGQHLREYMLDHFEINAAIASKEECNGLARRHFSKLQAFKRKYFNASPNVVEEKQLLFDPQYLNIKGDACLSGYFQSERYFADIATELVAELRVKTAPSVGNKNMLEAIIAVNAVSLHVRRGDFVSDKHIQEVHGTCDLQYYADAVRSMAEKVEDPVFYIFSDDISWAKRNFNLSYKTCFVDINDHRSSYEDIRLMQHCRHHILANSTFSWWGAWLNRTPGKIVIAPKKWFNDPALNLQTDSLVPASWIRL